MRHYYVLRVLTVAVFGGLAALVGCSHGPSSTPLHDAARQNNAAGVKSALSGGQGVDVRDSSQGTPLIEAAKNGSLDSARALLDAGANIEAKDKYDYTPLHWAAYNGQL